MPETVDLVMPQRATLWHIVKGGLVTWCGIVYAPDQLREDKLDVHVFSHRGKRVCSRCRTRFNAREGA